MGSPVLIVEDDHELREILVAGLEGLGFEIAGAHACGESALRALDGCNAQVALVDLGLPGLSGTGVIRALRRRMPDLPVLVLTVFETPEQVIGAIEAGARGYLLKGTPLAETACALAEVRDGLSPISPGVARYLLDRFCDRRVEPAPSELTDRELEVLRLLVRGHSYASTGVALDIGVGTVQSHVKNIYRKLQVASKTEAASVAFRHGLLSD